MSFINRRRAAVHWPIEIIKNKMWIGQEKPSVRHIWKRCRLVSPQHQQKKIRLELLNMDQREWESPSSSTIGGIEPPLATQYVSELVAVFPCGFWVVRVKSVIMQLVTLMALWIEAFFSPVWLNSNGLCFHFPPRNKAGEHPTHTQRHTNTPQVNQEQTGGACRVEGRRRTPGDTMTQTGRQTGMITWLISLWTEQRVSRVHQADTEPHKHYKQQRKLEACKRSIFRLLFC